MISKLTGEKYDDELTIKIPNQLQSYKYMINKLPLVDIIYTDRLVFIFNKEQSKSYFDKWCKHEL
jgi:23S rRNA-/tRNA-specific pseudouridylate synthase